MGRCGGAAAMTKRLKARSHVVRDSVSRIVLKVRRLRSPEAIRRAMEVVP
jgi:hypothetical protein